MFSEVQGVSQQPFLVLGTPSSPFVLFNPQNGRFLTPQTLRFKGKMSNFDAQNTIKLGAKTSKRTNGSISTHAQLSDLGTSRALESNLKTLRKFLK